MSFPLYDYYKNMSKAIRSQEHELKNQISQLVSSQEVFERVIREAKHTASKRAAHIIDKNHPEPPEIPNINVESDEQDEYLLILDYLITTGCKWTDTVLRFESQHPGVKYDRKELCKRFGFPKASKRPILVQIIEERLQQIEEGDA